MEKIIKIALLGSMPKGDATRSTWTDWKQEYISKIQVALPQAVFLHGDLISDSAGPEMVVGHDLWLIRQSDIVIVNASEKVGAGTAQEMILAKYFHKPVVSVLPRNTHHRKDEVVFHGTIVHDWMHPFLKVSSDNISETIEDAIAWIQKYVSANKEYVAKDITVFDELIGNFENQEKEMVDAYCKNGW